MSTAAPVLFSSNLTGLLPPKQRPWSCSSPASLPEPPLLPLFSLYLITDINLFAAESPSHLSHLCLVNSLGMRAGFNRCKFKSSPLCVNIKSTGGIILAFSMPAETDRKRGRIGLTEERGEREYKLSARQEENKQQGSSQTGNVNERRQMN